MLLPNPLHQVPFLDDLRTPDEHRPLEVFLIEVLRINRENVHQEAC